MNFFLYKSDMRAQSRSLCINDIDFNCDLPCSTAQCPALRARVMRAAMPMGQPVSQSISLSVCGLWIMMERNNWPRDGDGATDEAAAAITSFFPQSQFRR